MIGTRGERARVLLVDDVIATGGRFAGAGVAHFFLSFPAPSLAEALADLAWFAQDVRPLVQS